MAIFVTGATGLVGGHVVNYLLQQTDILVNSADEIICLVRNPSKATELKQLGVKMIHGDLSNIPILNKIFNDYSIKYVFHIAACVSVYASFEEMFQTNVIGTKNLLEAFSRSSARSFIHTSSIIVYDHHHLRKRNTIVKFTESSPIGPKQRGKDIPYAVSKRIGEDLVVEFAKRYPDKSFLITRLGPIIGKGDRQMIPSLVKAFALPLPKLINKGLGQISLTAPLDVARAQVFLVKNGNSYSGQAFNIAKERWNFRQLFNVVAEYYNRPPPKISIPLWLFRLFKPFLHLIKIIWSKSEFIQTLLSSSALEYMEYSYEYDAQKLKNLGFQFTTDIKNCILKGLQAYDPEKLMVSKRIKRKEIN
ncbi:MAG: NAD-dependent epimerase/dehydratase family protein [Candidatus Lokiarchaeota archaeon]|nr:NAD-dependent epimerase/dehydratase family protein [Candidatus Harpocratesius repetitus]